MITLPDLLLFLSFSLACKFLVFVVRRHRDLQAFTRLGIPGPKPSFFSGNLYDLNRAGVLPHEVIDQWIARFGNVFGYFIGERPHLVVNDREILCKIFLQNGSNFRNRPGPFLDVVPIKDSLLFQKDETWKRMRRVLQPVFSQNQVKVETISRTISECANKLIESCEQRGRKRSDGSLLVPFYPRMQATSLDVIARTALNLEPDVHNDKDAVLCAVKEYFSEAVNVAVNMATVLPVLRPIMTFVNDYMTAGAMTDIAVSLSHIVQSIDQLYSGSGTLTDAEVIANAHLVLLAGYETTANSVTFLMYYLAKHKDYQERLRHDFSNDDDEFFQMVWMESLRIVPPVTSLVSRTASQDVEIDGIRIEAGTVVEAPVWTIQHDPDIWPDPHTFDPFRFSTNNRKSMDPITFLAFGAGARYCLGYSLATEEAKVIVRAILTRFHINLPDDQPLKLKSQTHFLNPAGPMNLLFVPIK